MESKELWHAFKNDEKDAFSQLFHAYYPKLHRYGIKLTRDEEMVRDVIQDFFLYLYKNKEGTADEIENPHAYILTSFRRLLIKEIKRRMKEQNPGLHIVPEHRQFTIGVEDVVIKEETVQRNKSFIVDLLNELPPRQKEIIYLKYYHDLSLPEIAEALSISYQVIANHLYRALKKLRESDSAKRFSNFRFLL